MNEVELFASLGRKQVQIEAQDAAYTQLLKVLDHVVKGEITADRVTIDLTARTWAVAPQVTVENEG